jgi:hypothetical protein
MQIEGSVAHKPALVNTSLTDNDGNVRGSFRGDVKTWRVAGQIAVKIPANPKIAEFEGSGDAATHNRHTYNVGFMERQGRTRTGSNNSII